MPRMLHADRLCVRAACACVQASTSTLFAVTVCDWTDRLGYHHDLTYTFIQKEGCNHGRRRHAQGCVCVCVCVVVAQCMWPPIIHMTRYLYQSPYGSRRVAGWLTDRSRKSYGLVGFVIVVV
jgi:hypothetical protein